MNYHHLTIEMPQSGGLIGKLRAVVDAYKGVQPDSTEGRMVADMKDMIGTLQVLYMDALVDASENFDAGVQKITTEDSGGVRYQARPGQYERWEVEAALWDALDHGDKGQDNLIRVGNMPQFVVDKLRISGDFYIYRNHAYENMVSEEQAKAEGRFSKKAHYHRFGIEMMAEAILALEDPILTVATKTKDGNPAVMMILPVVGNNNAPLYAMLSFYASRDINGAFDKKPHIVLTVAERAFTETGGRAGLLEIVDTAVRDGRVISFDKKKRDYLSVNTKATSLGIITEQSLNANLSQFRKEIKAFREKNNINYSVRDVGRQEAVTQVLEKENAKLREDVAELRELVNLQRQVTNGTKFTKTSVEAAAISLKQGANAKGSTQELAKLLNGLYEYIASGKELTWEGVKEQAQGAVDWLWEHIDRRGKPTEYAQEILRQIHGARYYSKSPLMIRGDLY